ncbi:MAG: phenylalanine--tRNA ligase subunit alpha [Clostridia bacterium]|nr:phenylalanine--tRNA ligase subunit alpha [Clostridia bacterium]
MLRRLETAANAAIERIKSADAVEKLDEIYVAVLGRNGELTTMLRAMAQMDKAERAEFGKRANVLKQRIEADLNARRAALALELRNKRFEAETVDVTCPGTQKRPVGRLHPLTIVYREIRDALLGMGFTTFNGPEVEYEKYNFTMLNLPADHPARDMQDTFYVNDDVLLRTHTSPVEVRALTALKPPFRVMIPGKVFRVDEVDATHSPVFMQIEAMVVDRRLTMGDLKGTIDTFTKAVFGENVRSRMRPSYFPFTEPSAEVDISCTICGGTGCRVCKGTGWIEIMGCGMSNPHELENCGYDPREWSAFALGVGVDRVASLKYGISDIRLQYECDARFLKQFWR